MTNSITQKYDELYHYTNQRGLEGILSSRAIHATHYQSLNDSSEMMRARIQLESAMLPHAIGALEQHAKKDSRARKGAEEKGGIHSAAGQVCTALVSSLYNVSFGNSGGPKFFEPYIFSLCAHERHFEKKHGLLSQWRGYGIDAGYALVLPTDKLVEFLKRESDQFAYANAIVGDVIYEGEGDKFSEEFAEFLALLSKAIPSIFEGASIKSNKLYDGFVTCVSRFKHQGFSEEREVRAVLSPIGTKEMREIYDRDPDTAGKVRYKKLKPIEFKPNFLPHIIIGNEQDNPLPIKKIIIGPHSQKTERLDRLRRYLEVRELEIEAVVSETPMLF